VARGHHSSTITVAVTSGLVLATWLVGTSMAALSGFYFPPVSGPPPVLVPTFLVPLAVMVHVVSLRQLLGATWSVRQPA
jgi:hypothetical protein